MKKLIVNKHGHDFERSTIALSQILEPSNYSVKFVDTNYNLQEDETPVGNINFVEHFLGRVVKPDYYPEWTKSL